jgi:Phage integrase family
VHGLRHTHATLALKAGVHSRVVQERLGHASIRITLDRYSHVAPGMQEEEAAKIATLVAGESCDQSVTAEQTSRCRAGPDTSLTWPCGVGLPGLEPGTS